MLLPGKKARKSRKSKREQPSTPVRKEGESRQSKKESNNTDEDHVHGEKGLRSVSKAATANVHLE